MAFVTFNVICITKYIHKAARFLLYFNADIISETNYYVLYVLCPVNAFMMFLCFAQINEKNC